MEDTEKRGWEVQGGYEDGESSGVKAGGVLDIGLRIGKRIVAACFVLTSAPIVLPPLVVISAIGLVCSIPYGFYLASYTCTEKLLSKLLPCPDASTSASKGQFSPFLLGYKDDDEEYGGGAKLVDVDRYEEDVNENVADGEQKMGNADTSIGSVGEAEGEKGETEVTRDEAGDDVLGVVIAIEREERLGMDNKEAKVLFEVTDIAVENVKDKGVTDNAAIAEKHISLEEESQEASRNTESEAPKAVEEHRIEENGSKSKGLPEKKDIGVSSKEEKKAGKINKLHKGKAKAEKNSQGTHKKEAQASSKPDAIEITDRKQHDIPVQRDAPGLQQSYVDSGAGEG